MPTHMSQSRVQQLDVPSAVFWNKPIHISSKVSKSIPHHRMCFKGTFRKFHVRFLLFLDITYIYIFPKTSNPRSHKEQMWATMCSCGSNLKMTISCPFVVLFGTKKVPNHITMVYVLLKNKEDKFMAGFGAGVANVLIFKPSALYLLLQVGSSNPTSVQKVFWFQEMFYSSLYIFDYVRTAPKEGIRSKWGGCHAMSRPPFETYFILVPCTRWLYQNTRRSSWWSDL